MVRTEAVNALVDAALIAMGDVPDTTSSEVASAALTLTLRLVQVTIAKHPEQCSILREAVETILLACADTQRPN